MQMISNLKLQTQEKIEEANLIETVFKYVNCFCLYKKKQVAINID